ncbi:hypothetical protein I3J14_18185, partial [Streptomyces sp. HB-N217]|nr:hypothetical protein [Streptomyces sp. HB-N217]
MRRQPTRASGPAGTGQTTAGARTKIRPGRAGGLADADGGPGRRGSDHSRRPCAPHAEFERLWEQAVRRSPHHYGSHVAALEYLADTSPGAHGE